MSDESPLQTYRAARDHDFSRLESAALAWMSIDPDEDISPEKTITERAEEFESKFSGILFR